MLNIKWLIAMGWLMVRAAICKDPTRIIKEY